MYEEQIQTITAQVAEALAEQGLPFAPDRRAALELLSAPGWAEELAQLLPIRRRMECGEVLELCSPILPKLSPAPEDGWLSFCYRYIRGAGGRLCAGRGGVRRRSPLLSHSPPGAAGPGAQGTAL